MSDLLTFCKINVTDECNCITFMLIVLYSVTVVFSENHKSCQKIMNISDIIVFTIMFSCTNSQLSIAYFVLACKQFVCF